MKKLTPLLLTTLFSTHTAHAIVNTEGMRVGQPEQGFSGNLDLSLSGKSGNSDTQSYALGGRAQWQHQEITDFVVLSYEYGESNDVSDTNKGFAHARHVVQFKPRTAWEAYLQIEKNEFTRLSYRGLAGAGFRFTLAEEKDRIGLYFGAGAFHTREKLEQRAGLTDDDIEDYNRAGFYLSYKHQINSQVSVISTTYYQPRLGEAGDYRLLEQAALQVKMSDRLALKLSLDVSHDNEPPQSVEETDTAYFSGLSYSF